MIYVICCNHDYEGVDVLGAFQNLKMAKHFLVYERIRGNDDAFIDEYDDNDKSIFTLPKFIRVTFNGQYIAIDDESPISFYPVDKIEQLKFSIDTDNPHKSKVTTVIGTLKDETPEEFEIRATKVLENIINKMIEGYKKKQKFIEASEE